MGEEIAAVRQSVKAVKTLRAAPGLGVLGATALAATLGDGRAWRNGREFAASLGLCPGRIGTGGKVRIGGISRRGDPDQRTVLAAGARAVVARKNCSAWVQALLSRRPTNVAVVALAKKLARTAWALIAHHRHYDTTMDVDRAGMRAQCRTCTSIGEVGRQGGNPRTQDRRTRQTPNRVRECS